MTVVKGIDFRVKRRLSSTMQQTECFSKTCVSDYVAITQSIKIRILLRRFKKGPKKKVLLLRIVGEESLTSSIFLRLNIAGRALDSSSR